MDSIPTKFWLIFSDLWLIWQIYQSELKENWNVHLFVKQDKIRVNVTHSIKFVPSSAATSTRIRWTHFFLHQSLTAMFACNKYLLATSSFFFTSLLVYAKSNTQDTFSDTFWNDVYMTWRVQFAQLNSMNLPFDLDKLIFKLAWQ